MSRQINFSDLSDAQKEGYLKFLIENDIPLQQDDDSSNLDFVAKISLPAATKQINNSYDSSERSLDQVAVLPQQGKCKNTNNNKENDNQRVQGCPYSRKNTELSEIALKKNSNNLKNCISITRESNHSRGNSGQDFESQRVPQSQLKQSTGKQTPFKSFSQKKETSIQKAKVTGDNIFSQQKGNKQSSSAKNEITIQSKTQMTKQSSKDYSTTPQSSSLISTPDRNADIWNLFPSSPLKQPQQHRQKQQSRTSHGNNNILVVETDSHTESTNSTTEHSSNKPNMSDIYSILRSVGFSPKYLFQSENGEEQNGNNSSSSFQGEMKSNPTALLPMKREDQRKNINNVGQSKKEKKEDDMQYQNNDNLQSNKTKSQRKSSFIPCQTETLAKKDQSRCLNLLSRFSNCSQNQTPFSTNKTKQRSISPYSSKEQQLSTPSPALSRVCSPQKVGISPLKTTKKAGNEQNILSTTTLKSKSSQRDSNDTPIRQSKGYQDKSLKKGVTQQISKMQTEMSKSPLRNGTNSKSNQISGKINSEQEQCPAKIVQQLSSQDRSPSKMESTSDKLFSSVGYEKYPNISKLLKHKPGRISKMPIGQTKSIIEEIYLSSSRAGSRRFKGQFREFVYEFFQCKFKKSTNIAEGSLVNFLASLEFHCEASPAAQQFLEIMEANNESQLQFLVHAMQELQGYFKQTNLIYVRITEKQLLKLFILILGEAAKPFIDKFLDAIQQTEEFKVHDSISAQEFLAIFSSFRSTPELQSLNANCKDYETRRHSGQRFQMINESFGLVQECLSSRRETKQQQRGQQQQGIQQKLSYHSNHVLTPIKESIATCHSVTATTTNTHSRQSSTLSSLSAVQNLFDEGDARNNLNYTRDNNVVKETKQDFLMELNEEMNRMVHEFVRMFEIKSTSNMKKLQGLISKKCRLLISALGSGEHKNKWFELLAIADPTYQQKMQAETIEKLFEAYQNSHVVQGKDQGNIRSLCRIILKVPELSEAISKLLICLLVPED